MESGVVVIGASMRGGHHASGRTGHSRLGIDAADFARRVPGLVGRCKLRSGNERRVGSRRRRNTAGK